MAPLVLSLAFEFGCQGTTSLGNTASTTGRSTTGAPPVSSSTSSGSTNSGRSTGSVATSSGAGVTSTGTTTTGGTTGAGTGRGTGSPNCTIVTAAGQQIVDAQGNVWTVSNGTVLENGSAAGFTETVVEIAYVNGEIYQKNGPGGWWVWSSGAWVAASDPAVGSCSTSSTGSSSTSSTGSSSSGTTGSGTGGGGSTNSAAGSSGTTGTTGMGGNAATSSSSGGSAGSGPCVPGGGQTSSVACFLGSLGVNAHIDSGESEWEDTALLLSDLQYLGVNSVRDGTPYASYLPVFVALAQTGIKFNLGQSNATQGPFTTVDALADTDRTDALVAAVPGSVESLEGANEYNINSYDLNGVNSEADGLSWGVLDDQDLQSAVQADPNLAGVLVVAASVEDVTMPALGIGPYIDVANSHVYAGVGEQLQATELQELGWAQTSAPGKPNWVTEAGISSSGYGTSFWGVTDEPTQGIILTNVLLDGWFNGVGKTFLYDLVDDGTVSTTQEDNFGLFQQDGTPKAVATDIHNLTTILADPGNGSFQPGVLNYTLSGLPTTGSSMLLEKSDGTFCLVVWNSGATLYNGSTNVTPPSATVTVSFGSANHDIAVYDPIQGVSAINSVSASNSVSFGLSADPIILEISP